MNGRLRTTLRIVFGVTLATLAIAAALAFAALIAGQFWPDAGSAHIQWGSHSTTLDNAFSGDAADFFVAWVAITLAMVLAVGAVAFGVIVTLGALAFAAAILSVVALVLGFPLILVGAVVWLVVRSTRRTQPPTGTAVASHGTGA